jgi:hypothetical protein
VSVLLVASWGAGSGCAVLTKSQVQEVKAFARAAEGYGTLPGEPIRVYAAVDRVDRILIVSARNFAEPAAREKGWEELQKANVASAAFANLALQADRTLDILDTYARLLVELTSSEFTDTLDASAKSLGTSLDAAISRYNEVIRAPNGRSPLGMVGGTVAAMVRGTGGIWLRHQQARQLKAYVIAAQPAISELAADVQTFMIQRVQPDLEVLEARLKNDFETAGGRRQTLPLDTLVSVADAREQIARGRQLCHSAAAAAAKLSVAHAKLAQAITTRHTLGSHLEEIQALADEIKRAKQQWPQTK